MNQAVRVLLFVIGKSILKEAVKGVDVDIVI